MVELQKAQKSGFVCDNWILSGIGYHKADFEGSLQSEYSKLHMERIAYRMDLGNSCHGGSRPGLAMSSVWEEVRFDMVVSQEHLAREEVRTLWADEVRQ
jgi:hypothetical protein